MTKIFKTPFAEHGDRVAITDEAQPDGTVSYGQGYGAAYGLDPNVNAAALNIEREKMNGIFHDITGAVGEVQTFGAAQWSSDAQPYPLRALVYHNQKIWQSRIDKNKTEPQAGNDWVELKADLTAADVGAYSKEESDKHFQVKGDYATNTALNGKLDKSSIVQTAGQSTNQIMSQKAVTDALSHAVSIDVLYPVGIVLWFAQDKNPNHLFSGTTWKYIGEHRTIRLAASNGSDVLSIGGSDSISLTASQMPVHHHSFNVSTESSGGHSHSRGSMNITGFFSVGAEAEPTQSYASGAFSNSTQQLNVGASSPGRKKVQTTLFRLNAAEAWSGETSYSNPHTHMVRGSTSNTGSGSNVNITNSYIMLMGWYRTA
ncbi:phage baseplate protein [Xenorhabdus innexi]|uniref:Phage tail protein n=1 Tax=Xenorhabdus innexi TaxID=290109 RepID=A0A1N6N049_9GAMM|nr:hypothetical protein [Xenorhabdus innexi]PHM37728.1 phage tail protein [Xenorhabdus innexi]SIP74435.1 conserved hypothetical protein [Xenorhabdus innexi]